MRKVYHRILQIAGNVIMVEADDVGYNELAEVRSERGVSLAQVIRLSASKVYLQVFAGTRGVSTNDEVRFLGKQLQVSASDKLMGRVFDGGGNPRDNGPHLTEEMIDIGGPSVNPAKRIIPRNMIRTGIPMIDVFNTLVESQKLPIFSIAGEPYNELLARIAMQAEVDVIILGGMGIKYDDYLIFRETLEKEGALSRSVLFIHTASDPVVECLLVPDMALAVAEAYAVQGKKVLTAMMCKHVDDLKLAGERETIIQILKQIETVFGQLKIDWNSFTNCGVRHTQDPQTKEVKLDQDEYIKGIKAHPQGIKNLNNVVGKTTLWHQLISFHKNKYWF